MSVDIWFMDHLVVGCNITAFLEFLLKCGGFLFILVSTARLVMWLNRQNKVNQDFKEQSTNLKGNREYKISFSHLIVFIIAVPVTALVAFFWRHVIYWFYIISVILDYVWNCVFLLTVICAVFAKIPVLFSVSLFLIRKFGIKVCFKMSKVTYKLANILDPSKENCEPPTAMTTVESDDSELNPEYGPNAPSLQTRDKESDEEPVLSFKTRNCTPVEESTAHLVELEESEKNQTEEVQKWVNKCASHFNFGRIATFAEYSKMLRLMADFLEQDSYFADRYLSCDSTDTMTDHLGDATDTCSVRSGGSGDTTNFSVNHRDGTKAGINCSCDEGDNMSLKTGVSDISAYSEPSEEKGTKWGFTLIINMINFSEGCLESRDGAENDEEAVQTFFEKLGSQVVTARDLSKKKLMEMLEMHSKEDHSTYCYFACFIMSHGSEKGISCSDGELVSIAEIVGEFRKSQCPSLEGKPKMFVVDACLGSQLQMPEYDYRRILEDMSQNAIVTSSCDKEGGLGLEEDFFLIHSTLPGHVSLSSRFGSPWMTQLIQLLEDYSTKKENVSFDQVVKKLNKRMSAGDCYIKQVSYVCSTLKRNLFLKPGESSV